MCGTRALKLVRWIARPPNLNHAPLLQMEMQLKPKPIEERDNTPRLYRITISEPRAPHWPMSTHVNFRHKIERAEAKKKCAITRPLPQWVSWWWIAIWHDASVHRCYARKTQPSVKVKPNSACWLAPYASALSWSRTVRTKKIPTANWPNNEWTF